MVVTRDWGEWKAWGIIIQWVQSFSAEWWKSSGDGWWWWSQTMWIDLMPLSCTLNNGWNGKFYVTYILLQIFFYFLICKNVLRTVRRRVRKKPKSWQLTVGQPWWDSDVLPWYLFCQAGLLYIYAVSLFHEK